MVVRYCWRGCTGRGMVITMQATFTSSQLHHKTHLDPIFALTPCWDPTGYIAGPATQANLYDWLLIRSLRYPDWDITTKQGEDCAKQRLNFSGIVATRFNQSAADGAINLERSLHRHLGPWKDGALISNVARIFLPSVGFTMLGTAPIMSGLWREIRAVGPQVDIAKFRLRRSQSR